MNCFLKMFAKLSIQKCQFWCKSASFDAKVPVLVVKSAIKCSLCGILSNSNILNQKFSFRLTLDEMYATLPKSLKEQNLITASLIEDPEVVAKNQEIVKSKTPAQLAQINNLDEFPIPNNIETLIKKRTLKSTASKEASLNKR